MIQHNKHSTRVNTVQHHNSLFIHTQTHSIYIQAPPTPEVGVAYPAVERESEGRDELGRDFKSLHERVTMTHDVGRGEGREASSPFLRDKLRETSCGCVSV